MAMNTRLHVLATCGRKQRVHKVFVARNTRALRDTLVARLDLDWILEIAHCERQRMKEAVVGFGHPFTDRVMGQVAVVADGDMMVT